MEAPLQNIEENYKMIKIFQHKKSTIFITIINIIYLATQYFLQKIFIGESNFYKNIPTKEFLEYVQSLLLILVFIISIITISNMNNKDIIKYGLILTIFNIILIYGFCFLLNITFADTLFPMYIFIFSIVIGSILKKIFKNN